MSEGRQRLLQRMRGGGGGGDSNSASAAATPPAPAGPPAPPPASAAAASAAAAAAAALPASVLPNELDAAADRMLQDLLGAPVDDDDPLADPELEAAWGGGGNGSSNGAAAGASNDAAPAAAAAAAAGQAEAMDDAELLAFMGRVDAAASASSSLLAGSGEADGSGDGPAAGAAGAAPLDARLLAAMLKADTELQALLADDLGEDDEVWGGGVGRVTRGLCVCVGGGVTRGLWAALWGARVCCCLPAQVRPSLCVCCGC